MGENNKENSKNNKSSITTGATALISVLAVPSLVMLFAKNYPYYENDY